MVQRSLQTRSGQAGAARQAATSDYWYWGNTYSVLGTPSARTLSLAYCTFVYLYLLKIVTLSVILIILTRIHILTKYDWNCFSEEQIIIMIYLSNINIIIYPFCQQVYMRYVQDLGSTETKASNHYRSGSGTDEFTKINISHKSHSQVKAAVTRFKYIQGRAVSCYGPATRH